MAENQMITRMRVALVLCTTLLLSSCEQPRQPVNIAGNQWLGYQPLYIADVRDCSDCTFKQQYHSHTPFQLTIMPATTAVIRLLANQQLDAALLTLDEAMGVQASTGVDLCVAHILSYSEGADALVLGPNATLEQPVLRIGYEETALGSYMLHRALEHLPLNTTAVVPQMLLPTGHLQGIKNAEVDAVLTYQPFIAQIKEIGGQVVFDTSAIPYEVVDVLVVHTAVWQRERELLTWLTEQTWEFGRTSLLAREPFAEHRVLQNTGLSSEQLTVALAGLHFPTAAENEEALQNKLPAIVARLNSYLIEQQLISQPAVLPACSEV